MVFGCTWWILLSTSSTSSPWQELLWHFLILKVTHVRLLQMIITVWYVKLNIHSVTSGMLSIVGEQEQAKLRGGHLGVWWRYRTGSFPACDVFCPTWSGVRSTSMPLSAFIEGHRYKASCQTTTLWIEVKTSYVLCLPLDPAFSARLELSSRTAAMPRFPGLPGWSVAVDYQVVSSWKEASESWR